MDFASKCQNCHCFIVSHQLACYPYTEPLLADFVKSENNDFPIYKAIINNIAYFLKGAHDEAYSFADTVCRTTPEAEVEIRFIPP
jgi:hypothetical protein